MIESLATEAMVEDYKINPHAHVAGLKRLSARANAVASNNNSNNNNVFSFAAFGISIIDRLRSAGVKISKGLTPAEFERIEATFQFTFPPDLRGILEQGLPTGAGFPDWRDGGAQQLKMWIQMPKAGLCSEVERGAFWWSKQWGAKPSNGEQAVRVARAQIKRAPILIPVYGHCALPSSPSRARNPVFFVHDARVYCCAVDVGDLFRNEAFLGRCRMGANFVPDPVDLHAKRNLESTRRLIEKCSSDLGEKTTMSVVSVRRKVDGEEDGTSDDDGWLGCPKRSGECWGRSLDAIARHSDTLSRKSNESAKSVLTARSSEGSSDESSTSSVYEEDPKRAAVQASKAARRIDFWSDLAEKSKKQQQQLQQNVEDSLELIQMCCDEEDEAAADEEEDEEEEEEEDEEDEEEEEEDVLFERKEMCAASNAVTETMRDMSSRLRKGGWKEDEIAEIVDVSSGCLSCSRQLPDRQTVLEGLAVHLDHLSESLRRAGWSGHDVAESLCLDLDVGSLADRRPRTKLPAQVATRIEQLAAFVAQG